MFPLKVSNTNKYFCLAAGSPVRPLQTQHRGLHTGQGNLVTRCVLTRAVNAISRSYNICICAGIQSEEPAHDPPAGPAHLGAADVRAEPPQGAGDGAADPQPRRHEGVRLQGRGGVPRVSVAIAVTISVLGGEGCPMSRAESCQLSSFPTFLTTTNLPRTRAWALDTLDTADTRETVLQLLMCSAWPTQLELQTKVHTKVHYYREDSLLWPFPV